MAQSTARSIINQLIETCLDGERGFRAAAKLVIDTGLKELLNDLAADRSRFALQLAPHAQRLGGDQAGDGTAAAVVHRGWMDLKARLWGPQDRALLVEVLRGDGVTLRTYESALEELIPLSIRELVETQGRQIRRWHADLEEFMAELVEAA